MHLPVIFAVAAFAFQAFDDDSENSQPRGCLPKKHGIFEDAPTNPALIATLTSTLLPVQAPLGSTTSGISATVPGLSISSIPQSISQVVPPTIPTLLGENLCLKPTVRNSCEEHHKPRHHHKTRILNVDECGCKNPKESKKTKHHEESKKSDDKCAQDEPKEAKHHEEPKKADDKCGRQDEPKEINHLEEFKEPESKCAHQGEPKKVKHLGKSKKAGSKCAQDEPKKAKHLEEFKKPESKCGRQDEELESTRPISMDNIYTTETTYETRTLMKTTYYMTTNTLTQIQAERHKCRQKVEKVFPKKVVKIADSPKERIICQ